MTCLVAAGLVDPEWNYPSMIHVHSDSRGNLGSRTGSDGLAKSIKIPGGYPDEPTHSSSLVKVILAPKFNVWV